MPAVCFPCWYSSAEDSVFWSYQCCDKAAFLSLSSVLSGKCQRLFRTGLAGGAFFPVTPRVTDEKSRDGYLVRQLRSAEDSSLQGDTNTGLGMWSGLGGLQASRSV